MSKFWIARPLPSREQASVGAIPNFRLSLVVDIKALEAFQLSISQIHRLWSEKSQRAAEEMQPFIIFFTERLSAVAPSHKP